ncbi:MAG: zf-TFIIB domain-containing protein [Limisphaerales bacterium]
MKCPVDDTPLREVERGGFKLACCSQCTGLWLTRDTLKQAFASRHRPEKFDEAEIQPPLLKLEPARQRLCPCCNYQLAPRWLHGIEIDVCEKCQGLWLDAGELRQIVVNYQARDKLVAGNRESKWHDGFDFPCDADFFSIIGNGLGELASSGVDVAKPVVEFLGEALSLLDW